MIRMHNLGSASGGALRALLFLGASASAAACASQSSAFRQMSAADHETAARSSTPVEAQEHLDAAARLRDEEKTACYGLQDSERVEGPFVHPEDITAVEVVRDRGPFPKGPQQAVGVAIDLRAEPGMTQQWLGRVVACHAAHVAVVGQESRPSPLSVANAQVSVSATGVGFRIRVTSRDPDVARSVLRKGRELADSTYARPGGAIGVASAE